MCHCILRNGLSFGIESMSSWYDGVTHYQGLQLSPLLYNVDTDDINHHLLVTGVGCYVGDACVNSLSYGMIWCYLHLR